MRPQNFSRMTGLVPILLVAAWSWGATPSTSASKAKLTVFEATLEEQGQKTPELSTDEFKGFLAKNNGIVFDARPKQEFAIAHVPGSISIDEKGLVRLVQSFPDRATEIVVYSNGPFCEWARRRTEELLSLGYSKVTRYQLGLAIWRALGNPAETTLQGFRRIATESSAVLVDARSRTEYSQGTVPAAESILAGEVGKAMQDHRLKFYDHNTRIVVFANNVDDARVVAEEIVRNSYPNSSYFGGTYQELKRARFFSERKPSPSNFDSLTR